MWGLKKKVDMGSSYRKLQEWKQMLPEQFSLPSNKKKTIKTVFEDETLNHGKITHKIMNCFYKMVANCNMINNNTVENNGKI